MLGSCENGNSRSDFNSNTLIYTHVLDEGNMFDPVNNSLTSANTMPRTLHCHYHAILEVKIYLACSCNMMDNILTDANNYDIVSDTWIMPCEL